MARIIGRRVALAVPALLGVTILIFILMQVLPGSQIAGLLGQDATAQAVHQLRHQLGLDLPLPLQYLKWLDNALHGNLGYSYLQQRSVASMLKQAWWNTAVLAFFSALFGLLTGAALG